MMHQFAAVCALLVTAAPCAAQQDLVAISADGVPMYYDIHGTREPTLVFVHGWSNNRTFWQPHIDRLARSNQVVTLDLAGFGMSGRSRTSWTMEAFAQDVAAVLRQLPSQHVVLIGFSMGGAPVLEAARMAPQKVVGVVLVDIFRNPSESYSDSTIEAMVAQFRSGWHDPAKVRASLSPDAPDSLVSRYIAATPATPPDFWWEALRNFYRWSNSHLADALARLPVPLAAINRERPPTNVAAIRRYVPGFRLATMAGVGHLGVIWQDTADFDRLLLAAVSGFGR